MLNMAKMDEDERQEYECLLLEGHDEFTARRLARAANDRVNRARLTGPRTGDTKNGHGVIPLISDMRHTDLYDDVTSVTQESRTADQVLDDERAEARIAGQVELVRETLTPSLWRVMVRKFGLDGFPPAGSINELAEQLGLAPVTVNSALQKARQRCAHLV